MKNTRILWGIALGVLLLSLSCQMPAIPLSISRTTNTPTAEPESTPTPLPSKPVEPGIDNPDEPVFVRGNIEFTSPFFVNSLAEPFVMLEDEAGFVTRNREFVFNLNEQIIGPVELKEENTLTYSLSLPSVPQGTSVDVDNNGEKGTGVQVFAIAYWSNTWGGPFLEKRDGTGWSTAYTSTITDAENEDEIVGGFLIVWASDDKQGFPTGFGPDGLLFTKDDPTALIPAGYNIVDLNQKPFRIYKEAEPEIALNEGEGAVKDYSKLKYKDAFETMFRKISVEYPFTKEKGIDWKALEKKYFKRITSAKNDIDFYHIVHDFTLEFPDGHVGGAFNPQVFLKEQGGSFGILLSELTDGRVIISTVISDTPAARAGIQPGAELISWDGKPIAEAIDQVVPYFGAGSTQATKRLSQLIFLTRVPEGTEVKLVVKNPGGGETEKSLIAEIEYDTLTQALYGLQQDALSLPVEGKVIGSSNVAYIRIDTFSADDNLLARLWDRNIKAIIENDIPALIIDLRRNGGGNLSLAMNFASYFFDEDIPLYTRLYYNENSKEFQVEGLPTELNPAPLIYNGKIAVLVSPDCVSACEGFAYALTRKNRASVVGNFPTAGAFGEVGRGQYKLPGSISLQFPTGRPETLDGQLVIEGTGVVPDITVPITQESLFSKKDTIIEAAIETLTH